MNAVASSHNNKNQRQRIAVIGSGVSGASAAWALAADNDVVLYEADDRPGGHTSTALIDYDGKEIAVDTGFIVYNEFNYPDLKALFDHFDLATHESNMGFSLSLDRGRFEWSGSTWGALFARKRNVFSLPFLWMLRDIVRFNRTCVADRNAGHLSGRTIGDYLAWRSFSARFRDDYLIPMAAAIWSTPRLKILDFPAEAFVTFFDNHRLIQPERPIWRTVTGGSRHYLDKLLAPLDGNVLLGAKVQEIIRDPFGVSIRANGHEERFDEVVIAAHSDQALAMLGDPSAEETEILSAIGYQPNRVVLHRDEKLMPKRRGVWSAWNYLRSSNADGLTDVSVTYWMNMLQGIDASKPLFVTLNPVEEPAPDAVFGEWTFSHPVFDATALAAQARLPEINGHRRTWYAGAWTGYGFHEDGLRSGLDVAEALGAIIPWRNADTGKVTPALAAE